MLMHKLRDRVELRPVEASRPFDHNRIQPEFCDLVLASHMHMGRLTVVKGHKEKTIPPLLFAHYF